MKSPELPGLTGIRGLAALTVVAFHYRLPGFQFGWLAVDVFFVLSGFVLSHVYRLGIDRTEFLWHRFARVMPVHLATTVPIGIYLAAKGVVSYGAVAASAMLVHVVNVPAWSLNVEVDDYLIFAALAPLPIADRVRPWMLITFGSVLGVVGVFYNWGTNSEPLWQLCRGIGWFAVGVGLYRSGWRPRRCWLFDNRLAVWLGEISYPLYLVQYIPITLFGHEWPLLEVASSFAAAIALHYLVETPARRRLRALPGRVQWMNPALGGKG